MLLATLSVQRQAQRPSRPARARRGGPGDGLRGWRPRLALVGLAFLLPVQLFPPREPAVRFAFENLAYVVIATLFVAPAAGVIGRGGLPARVLGLRPRGRARP